MKDKDRRPRIFVRLKREAPPKEPQETEDRGGRADDLWEDAADAGNAPLLRVLPPSDREDRAPILSMDRSRLIVVMNEKLDLLAALICCSEELMVLYGREGSADKQLREMEELCNYYAVQYGGSHHRTMDMLHRTARLRAMRGEFPEALQLLERLYPLRVEASGRKDEKTLKCYALRAVVFEELGRHAQAQQSMKELRYFGSDVFPALVRSAEEKCEEIYKAKRKGKSYDWTS